MENYLPSTLLSMDTGSFPADELEREMNRPMLLSWPPDINLPLLSEMSPPPLTWNDSCDFLDVSLAPHIYEAEAVVNVPKVAKKCIKRLDSVWGAWFFFTFYFKPVLNGKSKSKVIRDGNGVSAFLVQHDLENMYMWVFKERLKNALGKMQLRLYMNGHSRQGERPFPFSVDKGFVRSHRMQRKRYRGLSNPQCLHGIEVVPSPNLSNLEDEEKRRWKELTGRDINFSIPPEASDFAAWRILKSTEFELEQSSAPLKSNLKSGPRKLLNGTGLNLSTQPLEHSNSDRMNISPACDKRKKEYFRHGNDEDLCLPNNVHFNRVLDMKSHPVEPTWMNEFSGVMRNVYGPITATKTIYEDDEGFLIIVSLPFSDLLRVKVTWTNTSSHGIVKISCVSTACRPFIKRHDRTFKLTDPAPEHCPPGEFIREISLPNCIPEGAKLEAYRDETGTMLEIIVPKHHVGPEEHEVSVCFRPSPWSERAFLDLE